MSCQQHYRKGNGKRQSHLLLSKFNYRTNFTAIMRNKNSSVQGSSLVFKNYNLDPLLLETLVEKMLCTYVSFTKNTFFENSEKSFLVTSNMKKVRRNTI